VEAATLITEPPVGEHFCHLEVMFDT